VKIKLGFNIWIKTTFKKLNLIKKFNLKSDSMFRVNTPLGLLRPGPEAPLFEERSCVEVKHALPNWANWPIWLVSSGLFRLG
jgi:hypothetical protein